MDMKEYIAPEIIRIIVSPKDVITTSKNVGGGIIITPEDEFEDDITNA